MLYLVTAEFSTTTGANVHWQEYLQGDTADDACMTLGATIKAIDGLSIDNAGLLLHAHPVSGSPLS